MTNTVHVAVAVIRHPEHPEQMLIARRPDHLHQGGLWEFPGGKVEPGETVPQALVREIQEELGILCDVEQLSPLLRIHHNYSDKSVLLDVWTVWHYDGEPLGAEGQSIRWAPLSQLTQFPFPAANQSIIDALMLPERYVFVSETSDGWPPVTDLPALAAGALIRLRPRAGSLTSVISVLPAWEKQVAGLPVSLILPYAAEGDYALLASQVGVALGVHLTSEQLRNVRSQDLQRLRALGIKRFASCHNRAEIEIANTLPLNAITVSPVRETPSHPGEPPLGWDRFAELLSLADMPVYALGGMTPADLPRARHLGAAGIAGIRGLQPLS